MAKRKKAAKKVETFIHDEASRKNIPTAEYQAVMDEEVQRPIQVAYERRNRDLDPQLVWRGKDDSDWSDLVVQVPPLFIQEKIHPKVLVDDLLRRTKRDEPAADEHLDLFADFNGLPSDEVSTEFYKHDANWTNRMILGDSLQVMASLAEREGLRGKVQCIYIDPPYGIKFNSNFQWSTTSREVKDGKAEHITREPEQVKAFRDTWRDGIHSYLTYLRDRLTVARDLLTESGSVFVQIGDENVHRVRMLMDEVLGAENYVSEIIVVKSSGLGSNTIPRQNDFILWYARDSKSVKVRPLRMERRLGSDSASAYRHGMDELLSVRRLTSEELGGGQPLPKGTRAFRYDNLTKPGPGAKYDVAFEGKTFTSKARWWGVQESGMQRAIRAGRIAAGKTSLSYLRFLDDSPSVPLSNLWLDTATGSGLNKVYVVQTTEKIAQRCLLLSSDPGDLVVDPTCGSGTTAYVAEQWGRRWITIDTSRVALTLARARIMGGRYPYHLLNDSADGQRRLAEVEGREPSSLATSSDIRQGFVYQRLPHVTLRAIVNNAEIDVIFGRFHERLEPLRERLNSELGEAWEEWEIPGDVEDEWSTEAQEAHAEWWELRVSRQSEIDASIAAKTDFEYLYDKPYEDNTKVRVAGPFTVEGLLPHRVLPVDENDELVGIASEQKVDRGEQTFTSLILENLERAGVQQAHKEDKIEFTSLTPWPGDLICADGGYFEGSEETGAQKRAAIFIGPEFGTVSRPDLVAAAREASEAGFDVLIACAFNYEAHTTEFNKLGKVPVLKARMNADLHMAKDLKATGKGNLFVIFGEPDIEILDADDGEIRVRVNGVDVFHPNTGEIRSDGAEGIACWFVDSDYNAESFFVRQAYFLGAGDPYKSLKTTLKAEINKEAWETLHSDTSRSFPKPESGRIAVKVINHLGDEVMKVFRVD
jgi:adenine-specific DNA-methyltransferase